MTTIGKSRATLVLSDYKGTVLQKVLTEAFAGHRLHSILTDGRAFQETGYRLKLDDSYTEQPQDSLEATCVTEWKGLIEDDPGSKTDGRSLIASSLIRDTPISSESPNCLLSKDTPRRPMTSSSPPKRRPRKRLRHSGTTIPIPGMHYASRGFHLTSARSGCSVIWNPIQTHESQTSQKSEVARITSLGSRPGRSTLIRPSHVRYHLSNSSGNRHRLACRDNV